MDKNAISASFLRKLVHMRVGKGFSSAASSGAAKGRVSPEWFRSGLHGVKDTDRVYSAYRKQSLGSGDESLLLWPVKALASKILPKKLRNKAKRLTWKYIGAPALRADIAAGKVLEKIPGGKSLFRVKEELPWKKGFKREVERSSALAPLVKARDIAEPILVGVGLEKGIKKLDKMRHQGQQMDDQNLRTKVASVMLQLHEKNKEHEKRGHALRLLYKQAELGITSLPSTYSDLDTKLASLVNEDLVVLEKALELSGGNLKLGELSRKDTATPVNPEEKFQAIILGDEL